MCCAWTEACRQGLGIYERMPLAPSPLCEQLKSPTKPPHYRPHTLWLNVGFLLQRSQLKATYLNLFVTLTFSAEM